MTETGQQDGPAPSAGRAGMHPRVPAVDVARGVAIAAMFVYHFTWDLGHFGFIHLQAGVDPAWRLFSRLIAGSFLVLVGVGLVLAARGGIDRRAFLRRLAMVSAGALGVTVATWFLMRDAFVFFGILHCIAVSSVLALPFLRAPAWWTAAVGSLVMVLPAVYASPVFDAPAWWWLGLSTRLPHTNDYEPLLPWFGCVLIGVAAARAAIDRGWDAALARWPARGPVARLLALGGRHSLALYLVHQPVFFGLLSLAVAAGAPLAGPRDEAQGFVPSCVKACTASGAEAAFCTSTCACVAGRLAGDTALLSRAMRGPLPPADEARVRDAAVACRRGD